MIKKYLTPTQDQLYYGMRPEIKVIEIDSESEKYVWFNAIKSQKISECHVYHDSWPAARKFILDSLDRASEIYLNRMGLIRRNTKIAEQLPLDEPQK